MWSTELPNSVLVDGHIVQGALAEGAGGAEEEEDDDHEGGDDESAAGDSCGADGKPPAAKGKGRGRGAKHAATPKAMKTMKAKSPKKEEAASPKEERSSKLPRHDAPGPGHVETKLPGAYRPPAWSFGIGGTQNGRFSRNTAFKQLKFDISRLSHIDEKMPQGGGQKELPKHHYRSGQ